MGHLNLRGVLSVVSLVVYPPVLIGSAYLFYKYDHLRKPFMLIYLLSIVKIIGAAMTVEVQLDNNAALAVPAAILNSVVLTPLLQAISDFLNPHSIEHSTKQLVTGKSTFARQFAGKLFHLNTLIILASLPLAIIGGLDAFNADPEKWTRGRTFMSAAAGLWIAAFVAIIVLMVTLLSFRPMMCEFRRRAYLVIAFVVMPLLAVRIAYGCGLAFTIDTAGTQVFNPATGNQVLYLIMGFLPEVAIVVSLLVVGFKWGRMEY